MLSFGLSKLTPNQVERITRGIPMLYQLELNARRRGRLWKYSEAKAWAHLRLSELRV